MQFAHGRHLSSLPPTLPPSHLTRENAWPCAPTKTRYSIRSSPATLPANIPLQVKSIPNAFVISGPQIVRLAQSLRKLSQLSLLPPLSPDIVSFNTLLDRQASLRSCQQANKETSCRAESEEARRHNGNWCYCMLSPPIQALQREERIC
jgi:hypothetical protein